MKRLVLTDDLEGFARHKPQLDQAHHDRGASFVAKGLTILAHSDHRSLCALVEFAQRDCRLSAILWSDCDHLASVMRIDRNKIADRGAPQELV